MSKSAQGCARSNDLDPAAPFNAGKLSHFATQAGAGAASSGQQPEETMSISRRAALAGLAAMSAEQARAQAAFPTKPMTLVVPFPAGGPSDVFGRHLAQGMA